MRSYPVKENPIGVQWLQFGSILDLPIDWLVYFQNFYYDVDNVCAGMTPVVCGGGWIMVDLGGYVIILVETKDKRVKLYGKLII